MRSNCLIYALGRLLNDGGYLVVSRSQLRTMFPRASWHPVNFVPHFLHRDREHRVTQFVPTAAQRERHVRIGLWRSCLDLLAFEGEVVGDDLPPEAK